MGIQDIYKFINNYNVKEEVFLTQFANTSVAFDMPILIFKLVSSAVANIVNNDNGFSLYENLHSRVYNYVLKLFDGYMGKFNSINITPIMVFDGRRRLNKKHKRDYNDMYQKIKVLEDKLSNELDFDDKDINDLRKLYIKTHHFSKREMEDFKSELIQRGYLCLTSTYDAEELCSALCREGKVSAVLSTDSDNIVYGCPVLIKDISKDVSFDVENSKLTHKCIIYKYQTVLDSLEFTKEQFIEFCILIGCDFNCRIQRLGPKTAYKLIKEYKSIDNLPDKYNDKKECLNTDECREIFTFQPSEVLSDDVF